MKTASIRFVILFPLLLGLCGIVGCQKTSKLDGLVPASGVVMFDNAPVEGATVAFAPLPGGTGEKRTATATTDAKGRFSMMTLNPGDGVFPGEYVVTISKTEQAGEAKPSVTKEGLVVEGRTQSDGQYRDLLPVKYKEGKTSELKVTIAEKGDKKIEFKLEGEVDDTVKTQSGPSRRR